ncbi:Stk1 family PASTA domain-containing Ser/Thr kinase [Filibacter tadaridae]|uniref:Serine/threonine-protein kinase PrkC n=1 Tax=Filibacter tadaridae TaxID=2483811 RepID=A0A3P5X6B9_9BACL|nr:Stk1 family PASTA domain-containing Ser/Thr kinase [Filibacter tadaridae]VDC29803.1 Serine/threonine-protein kinase PrkC [Filibacter tadaridae]
MIGKRIGGRYEILGNIGDGGMSKVYLAHDVILNRDVAVKVLNYDFANEENLKRRFQREALSATSLTHPHIVDIFDVGEEAETLYLVMEYIEGQTLKKFIHTNGPLSPEKALPIMQQLVSAISNAHHNGIIHRDIKPQNILMDSAGDVKITDFGIAMALNSSDHTKTNSIIGTVHYLSPEQARGGMATKKSDIYSLGIVFYELLTGQLPFSAETAVAIALKHLQEEIPSIKAFIPSIPQSVENVILKATTKDPNYRYQSADEMYDDLLTVLTPERARESRFTVPFDDDRTRAIPVVTEPFKFDEIDSTKKIIPIVPDMPPAPVPVKKRKKWPIITGVIAGVVILFLMFLLMPSFLGPKKAEIPNVIGMEETEAISELEEIGFKVKERTEQPSDEYELGEIIRTIPEAGKKREVGSSVILYVSTGKETTEMADYTNRDYTQVTGFLDSFGFKSIKPNKIFSDEAAGTILKQDPEPGTEVIPGETDLLFTVSKGRDVRILGNLSGYSEDEVKEYAETSGFDITFAKKAYSENVPENHVISQEPKAGAELVKGGKVKVVLSKGKEEKPVKLLIQTVTIKYEPQEVIEPNPNPNPDDDDENGYWEQPDLAPIPQTIRIYVQDKKNTMADYIDEFTITEDKVYRIPIELEEGQHGAYKITRDSKIIMERQVNYSDSQ